jgi:hypothetical protein
LKPACFSFSKDLCRNARRLEVAGLHHDDRLAGIFRRLECRARRLDGRIRRSIGGAAIARVSGEADQVFRDLARDEAIAAALEIAERKAINAGADPRSLKTIEIEDMPIAYLPGNSLRVRVRVAGALNRIEASREVA